MSYLGPRDRDLLIPPRPVQSGMAETAGPRAPVLRFIPARPRSGPVQEASCVGIVTLSLSWAVAEIVFRLWG